MHSELLWDACSYLQIAPWPPPGPSVLHATILCMQASLTGSVWYQKSSDSMQSLTWMSYKAYFLKTFVLILSGIIFKTLAQCWWLQDRRPPVCWLAQQGEQ